MFISYIIGIYIIGIIAFCFFDALIGFGFEFGGDSEEVPPLILAAAVWPLSILIIILIYIEHSLSFLKNRRIKRQKYKELKNKLRVEKENNLERIILELEEEINATKNQNKS